MTHGRAAQAAGLDLLNTLPAEEAAQRLRSCCASPRWVAQVERGRPYPAVDDLLAASTRAIKELSEQDLDEALAGHPRIGERPPGPEGASSRREQRGVEGADAATLAQLAAGNDEYERLFGHVYLVCADGRSAEDLLAVLRQRLGNDPGTERHVTRTELGRITALRLRRLTAGGGAG